VWVFCFDTFAHAAVAKKGTTGGLLCWFFVFSGGFNFFNLFLSELKKKRFEIFFMWTTKYTCWDLNKW